MLIKAGSLCATLCIGVHVDGLVLRRALFYNAYIRFSWFLIESPMTEGPQKLRRERGSVVQYPAG